MWMTSNVRTIIVTRDENNTVSIDEVDPSEIPQQRQDNHVMFHMPPILLALAQTLVIGEDYYGMDFEEEKHKLSEEQFQELETCSEVTNCAICLDNKKMNIKLKCNHIFCKQCIKKWLTEKSNTCPNCRQVI
jgi:hypothetical protein